MQSWGYLKSDLLLDFLSFWTPKSLIGLSPDSEINALFTKGVYKGLQSQKRAQLTLLKGIQEGFTKYH